MQVVKKEYRIRWVNREYAISLVKASSPDEARKLALAGKDRAFTPDERLGDWQIEDISVCEDR